MRPPATRCAPGDWGRTWPGHQGAERAQDGLVLGRHDVPAVEAHHGVKEAREEGASEVDRAQERLGPLAREESHHIAPRTRQAPARCSSC